MKPDQTKDRGIHFKTRASINDSTGKLEKSLSDSWVKENTPIRWLNYGNGTLQGLFCKRGPVVGSLLHDHLHEVSESERMVAATVVQWLGTNCGRAFLEDAFRKAGWTLSIKPPKL